MDKLQYTDIWGNNYTLTAGTNDIKKFAFSHDFHRESESEFRLRSNFIANIFNADIEFRTDLSGWGRVTAYFRFAREFGESEEQFDSRVYLAHKAFSTYMPHLDPQVPGRCQKSSGRYPWNGREADFDIYQGINHETGKLQTIVKWNDGTTTIVGCAEGEEFSKELGLSVAIAEKYFEVLGSPYPRAALKKLAENGHDQTAKTKARRDFKAAKKAKKTVTEE